MCKTMENITNYEKAVVFWQRRKITTDAELAEALNSHSISFAYHSGRIENENITYNDTREIFEHRKGYYAALEAWDEKQELTLLEEFLREQTAKTWEKQIQRMR